MMAGDDDIHGCDLYNFGHGAGKDAHERVAFLSLTMTAADKMEGGGKLEVSYHACFGAFTGSDIRLLVSRYDMTHGE